MECQSTLPEVKQCEQWQEYEQEPWKTILHCDIQTNAADSSCSPIQGSFGFAIKAKEEDSMRERFEPTLECPIVDTPYSHKEDITSVEGSSKWLSGTILHRQNYDKHVH